MYKPGWTKNGADFDIDFTSKRSFGGSFGIGTGYARNYQSYLVIGGGGQQTTQYAPNSDGKLEQFGKYSSRITNLGLFIDPDRTNVCLQSRTFTSTTWTKNNCTVTKNLTGQDGVSNSAHTLTSTADNATLTQSITLTSKQVITSFYIKRISGIGTIRLSQDNGSTYTDITGLITSDKFSVCKTIAQTLTNPTIILEIAVSGDSIGIDFAMCEYDNVVSDMGTYVSYPLVTTTTEVRRATEEPAIGGLPQVNDGVRLFGTCTSYKLPWSCFVEFSTELDGSNVGSLLRSDENISVEFDKTGYIRAQSASPSNTINFGYNITNRIAFSVKGNGSKAVLNGGNISTIGSGGNSKPSQTFSITHCGIGNNGSAITPMCGIIKRITFWKRELSDGDLIDLTRIN